LEKCIHERVLHVYKLFLSDPQAHCREKGPPPIVHVQEHSYFLPWRGFPRDGETVPYLVDLRSLGRVQDFPARMPLHEHSHLEEVPALQLHKELLIGVMTELSLSRLRHALRKVAPL